MFRGHGILVLPFALLGLFVGSLVFGIIFLFVQVKVNWISIIMGLWCAAAAVWLYAVTFGRSRQEQVYNPATRAYESRLSRHAFLFMPPKTWALIFAGVALVGSVLLPRAPMPTSASSSLSSEARGGALDVNAFHDANLAITSAREGVAKGNTKHAVQLANDFSQALKLFREAGVEKAKKKSAVSLTGGEFVTYCHLTEKTCAFLVHVPDLRKFSGDAKEFIAEAAWHSATAAVLQMADPPERLAVGIRGVMLYDAILIGNVEASVEDAEKGIKRRLGGTDKEALYPFFTVPTRKKEVTTKAPTEAQLKTDASSAGEVSMPTAGAPPATVEAKPQETAPASMPAPQAELPTAVREWHSADGRSLKASLLGFNETGTGARLRREDGTEFEVGLDKFTAEDQAELRRLHQTSQAR